MFRTVSEELHHHQNNMAAGDWARCLKAHGLLSMEDAVNAKRETLDALLRDLRPTE